MHNLDSAIKIKTVKYISGIILANSYLQITITALQLNKVTLYLHHIFYSYDLTQSANIFYNLLIGSDSRIVGGIYQTNNLAELLTWGLFANILLWQKRSKLFTFFLWFNALIISIFIALTFSRLIFLFLIFLFIYSIILYYKKSLYYARVVLLHLIILCMTTFVATKGYLNFAYYASPQMAVTEQKSSNNESSSNASNRLTTSINNILVSESKHQIKLASDSQRLFMWKQGFQMFLHHPILGIGWYNYPQYIFINNNASLPQLALPNNSHNIFIQLLATTGLCGCLLFLTFVINILNQIRKLPPEQQILPAGIIICSLIHSQTEYPLFYLPFFFCFIFTCGLVDNTNIKQIPIGYFKVTTILISIIVIWQVYIGYQNYYILAQFKKPDKSNNNQYNNILNKYSIGYNPLWSYYSDLDMAQKLNFYIYNQSNKQLFDLSYETTKKVYAYTPFANFGLKLAVMEQLKGNSDAAKQLIFTIYNHYHKFESDLTNALIGLSNGNPELQSTLLKYTQDWKKLEKE
ncbi:PglL family O-oligosaccharyltransferase [Aquella oligotrophica]|nr:O-antigen ligase family protein [Aquella oligotrophica]